MVMPPCGGLGYRRRSSQGAIVFLLCTVLVGTSSQIISDNSLVMVARQWEFFLESSGVKGVQGGDIVGAALSNHSTPCTQELERAFAEGGAKRNTILDATGKPSAGIFLGSLSWLGDFRQCKDASSLHYCLADIKQKGGSVSSRLSLSVKWGVCVPEECSEKDVKELLLYVGREVFPGIRAQVTCDYTGDPTKDAGFIVTLIVISLICLLTLCATAIDFHLSGRVVQEEEEIPILQHRVAETKDDIHENSKPCNVPADGTKVESVLPTWKRVFLCFSLKKSMSFLMNTSGSKEDIRCIHGIRVVSMFWIILGHSFSFQQKSDAIGNSVWLITVAAKWFTSQAILNGYIALDSFFFIGGLLMSYTGMKSLNRRAGRVNWLVAIVYRYLRITPCVVMTILLYTFLYPYMGDGPSWPSRVKDTESCHQWWWTNLLFINNFVPSNTSAGCVSWTWYLAADMQFFLIGIPILILLLRMPKIGGGMLSICLAATLATSTAIYAIRDYPPIQILNQFEHEHNGMFPFTVKPYACAPAYLMGLAMGYFLHRRRQSRNLTLHPALVLLGWLVASALGMTVTYGLYGIFDKPGYEVGSLSTAESTAFGVLRRPAWAIALCWVVFACHFGYGGVINHFLSWKFWVPLSRLTFCAYLLHPAVIYLYTGEITSVYYPAMVQQSVLYAGFVTLSYSAALVMCTVIEIPVSSLQKLLMNR